MIAADDFTGPVVLKVQTNFSLSGRDEFATPDRDGPPRNIGHDSEQ